MPPHAPDQALLAAYETCSGAAEVRLLSISEASLCANTYLRLKLSFLPDVNLEEFRSLPALERWEIQQQGYRALLDWRENGEHVPTASTH